mmetsp:Transcript_1967/g.4480  ORF Transcript_1967/g.4480 Transcript_1967/m.4480 type:complete len:301 (+) Transcript_1967:893-1795(+)
MQLTTSETKLCAKSRSLSLARKSSSTSPAPLVDQGLDRIMSRRETSDWMPWTPPPTTSGHLPRLARCRALRSIAMSRSTSSLSITPCSALPTRLITLRHMKSRIRMPLGDRSLLIRVASNAFTSRCMASSFDATKAYPRGSQENNSLSSHTRPSQGPPDRCRSGPTAFPSPWPPASAAVATPFMTLSRSVNMSSETKRPFTCSARSASPLRTYEIKRTVQALARAQSVAAPSPRREAAISERKASKRAVRVASGMSRSQASALPTWMPYSTSAEKSSVECKCRASPALALPSAPTTRSSD